MHSTIQQPSADCTTDEPDADYTREVSEEYYTREELAKLLKLHPRTIDRKVRSGELPAIYLGPKSIRFAREDVIAWLRRGARREPT